MKKVRRMMIIVLVLGMIMINCGAVYADEEQISEDIEYDTWTLEQTVDEFGDPTGKDTLRCIVKGDFSNTATSGSDLTVIVYYELLQGISFRLLEYDTTKATYSSNSQLQLKIKVNDEISEYKLYGSSPNGDLSVKSKGLLSALQNIDYNNFNVNDTLDEMTNEMYAEEESEEQYYNLLNVLSEEEQIRCIIYIDNSKYNFTIPLDGFSELAAPNYYSEASLLFKREDYEQAYKFFLAAGDYSDASQKAMDCDMKINGEKIIEEKLNSTPTKIECMGDVLNAIMNYDELIGLRDDITIYLTNHFYDYPIVTNEELKQSFEKMVQWQVYPFGNEHKEIYIRYDFVNNENYIVRTNTGYINGHAENYFDNNKWDMEISDDCLIWKNMNDKTPEYEFSFVKLYDSYYLAQETNCKTGETSYALFIECEGFTTPKLKYYLDEVTEIIYKSEFGIE